MPRKAKPRRTTQNGAPAAPLTAPRGGPYGEGERALESQRRIPVPSGPPPVPGASGAGAARGPGPSTPPTAVGGPGLDPRLQMMAAMQAASRMRPPQSLYSPTQRPQEPITAGLPVGAGPGPEVIRTGDRVARTFRLIADITGDPKFENLAQLASRRQR